MRFTPKSKEELSKQRRVLKEGIADFTILSCEEKVSSKGNDMLKITLQVWDVDGTEDEICDYIVADAQWKLLQLCESIGKLGLYNSGDITPDSLQGFSGKCDIFIKKDPTRGNWPKIKSYLSSELASHVKASENDLPNFNDKEDEIPF